MKYLSCDKVVYLCHAMKFYCYNSTVIWYSRSPGTRERKCSVYATELVCLFVLRVFRHGQKEKSLKKRNFDTITV